MSESISLNKFISDTGYCSRREADALITAGRVLLNNRIADLGNRYKPGDKVEVDGSIVTIKQKEKPVYLAFNKPVGVTTTTEEKIKGNIISFIGFPKRIFPIGRLDKDSEGLIFLTNDGDMVNKLLRAGNAHEKEYVVRVQKPIEPGFVERMSSGIPLDGEDTLPCKVLVTGRQTFRIILVQGVNRQIRRMCEYLGYVVLNLQRVRIMQVKIDKLAVGKWRHLSEAELAQLQASLKDSTKVAATEFRKPRVAAKIHERKAFSKRSDTEKEIVKEKSSRHSDGKKTLGQPATDGKPASKRDHSKKSNSRREPRKTENLRLKSEKQEAEKKETAKKATAKKAAVKKAAFEEKKAARAKPVMGKYKAFRTKGRSRP